ncbi:hypothetical protein C8R42DRAFT_643857 [Lentinula raphanica]|nr:hypothetical protein C8R42DRAFT_643857 [Lentinula raphanica]
MPPKKDSKKGPKIGPLFELQKADPTQTLGSSANNPADDEPGQIREQTTEEDDSQTSSLGNTIRSSPLAAAADRKRENALLGNKPPELIAQQGNDTGTPNTRVLGIPFTLHGEAACKLIAASLIWGKN